MSWKITSTILNLSLLHIKSLHSLSARTMSSSSLSWEVRMQKRGRSTSLITCHPLSPLKKVGNQSFAFSFGVFGYLWASPSSSSCAALWQWLRRGPWAVTQAGLQSSAVLGLFSTVFTFLPDNSCHVTPCFSNAF